MQSKFVETMSVRTYWESSGTSVQVWCWLYVFAGCKTIDLVFALKRSDGKDTTYVPLFVSVKSRSYFARGDEEKICQEMKEKAGDANIERALCSLDRTDPRMMMITR